MPVLRDDEARRATGGPSRREPRSTLEGCDVEIRIAALNALTTTALQAEWQRLFRVTPPIRLSRDLLLRGVAYRLQEQAYGGLNQSARRLLRSFTESPEKQRRSRAAPAILKPGTRLVREWHEHVHTVRVLDDGFDYQGEHYRSLTQIARRITGVHWSGPLFFGLTRRQRAEATDE